MEKSNSIELPSRSLKYIIKYMVDVNCGICKSVFYVKPSWLKKGKGKYCSIVCSAQNRKTGKMISCFICGKEAYKPLKELDKSQNGKFFCSKKCSTPWRNSLFTGEKHPNWKHGEFSYKETIKRSKISQICILCGTKNKKVIIVHHADKNRKNNKLSNLAWLCRNCHFLVHHYEKENRKFLRQFSVKYADSKV